MLEWGEIYVFCRPEIEQESLAKTRRPRGRRTSRARRDLDDVQQFVVVLTPVTNAVELGRSRLVRISRQRLPPEIGEGERLWGYVEAVGDDPCEMVDLLDAEEHETKAGRARPQPAARPAGEGHYGLFSRDRDTSLSYELVLPEQPGPVQRDLNIASEARFVLSVRNPDSDLPSSSRPSSPSAPMPPPDYPPELRERFGDRRWIAADPPELLDYPGAEVLLIGAREEPGDDTALEPDEETARTADVFTRLRLDRAEHSVAPLLSGEWD